MEAAWVAPARPCSLLIVTSGSVHLSQRHLTWLSCALDLAKCPLGFTNKKESVRTGYRSPLLRPPKRTVIREK